MPPTLTPDPSDATEDYIEQQCFIEKNLKQKLINAGNPVHGGSRKLVTRKGSYKCRTMVDK